MIKIILADRRSDLRAILKKTIEGYDIKSGERTKVRPYQMTASLPYVLKVIRSTGIISKVPAFCRSFKPDMVIMRSEHSGFSTALEIHRDYPHIKLILIHAQTDKEQTAEAEKAGIHSYTYNRQTTDDLLVIIKNAILSEEQDSEEKRGKKVS